ncbi:hypothetical protein LTS02_012675 [Friedmanniomyces endolithicus]|nr:hypothetical protein LTS02_012675 [Friedmanniomyces endolithicus]
MFSEIPANDNPESIHRRTNANLLSEAEIHHPSHTRHVSNECRLAPLRCQRPTSSSKGWRDGTLLGGPRSQNTTLPEHGEDQMFKESIAPGFVRRLDNRAPQSQLFYPAAPLPADPAQPYAAAGSSRGYPNFVPEPPVQRYDGPPMVDARTGKPVARDHLGYPTQPARPAPGATQPAFPELLRRGDQGQGRRRGSSSRSGTPRAGAGEQGGSDDAFMWQLGG